MMALAASISVLYCPARGGGKECRVLRAEITDARGCRRLVLFMVIHS